MPSIRISPDTENQIEFIFEDNYDFDSTCSDFIALLGQEAILSYISDELTFSINQRDFEFLIVSENWLEDNYDFEMEDSIISIIDNFQYEQNELSLSNSEIERTWDSDSISRHLSTYSPIRMPTDFQMENLEQMLLRPAAASFSVPGSGKTGEGLCYWLCNRSEDGRLLVVLPRVGYIAWEEEFRDWIEWGSEEVIRLDVPASELIAKATASRNAKVFLITYARLRNNESEVIRLMSEGEWSMILDESHNIKSPSGSTSRAVRRVGNYARCSRLILTGTPAPQGLVDLGPQAEFLLNARANIEHSANWITEIKVRTTKEQLGLLPTHTNIISEPLPEAHQRIFDLLTNRIARNLEAENNPENSDSLRNIRRHIVDVMRASSNPRILLNIPSFASSLTPEMISDVLSTDSWKITRTVELVSSLLEQGRKVIIWSYFNDNTDELAARLEHFNPRIIRGSTPSSSSSITDEDEIDPNTREGILRDFKADDNNCRVIIANPAACGESISLHHWCHDAIYFDRSYNAGQYLQSCDRIHRYGAHPLTGVITCQEQQVTYHILLSTRTLDERIDRRLEEKIDHQNNILDSNDLVSPLNEQGTDNSESGAGVSNRDEEDFIDFIENSGDS